jgi:hypothetical protein
MDGFPDAATVSRLREFGVGSVVLHRDRVAGTPHAAAARRRIAGLGISRTPLGAELLVYELRSPAAAGAGSAGAAGGSPGRG